jgi:hypothetical protein
MQIRLCGFISIKLAKKEKAALRRLFPVLIRHYVETTPRQ